MRNPTTYFLIGVLGVLGVHHSIATVAVAVDIQAKAVLRSKEISLADSTILDIVIEGTPSVNRPQVPAVDGLEFTHIGQSTNLQFINGVMTGGVTYSYRVLPQREGEFVVPEIQVAVGKSVVKTSSLTLRVKKPSSSQLPAQIPSPKGGVLPSQSSSTSAVSPGTAMIQLVYPKRDFYIGELVPTDLKVYLHPGLQIQGVSLPTLSGTAFTVSKLGDRPEQTQEMIQGVAYTVLTWHTAVAAVKTGEHPLGAQMECAILVREATHRNSPFGDSLFDDFFSDSFSNRIQQKKVILRSQDSTVKILPLPTENQPSDFSGAIGRFQFSGSASSTEVTAGDPVTLKLTVSGNGNFDRIRSPELSKNQDFKTYTPSSKFEASDETGFSGQKLFEQIIIPQHLGVKQIPGLSFSFFDPENRKYVTIPSATIPLQVSPASAQAVTTLPSVPLASTSSSTILQPLPAAGVVELVPNKLELGPWVSNFSPVIFKPWFWCIPLFPLLALGIAWSMARRHERLTNDPDFARTVSANRVIRNQLVALDSALKQGDAHSFFVAARRILQERLAEQVGIRAETMTFSEIESCLKEDASLIHSLKEIFQVADAVTYSGQTFSDEKLNEWKQVILEILKKLKK